MRIQSLITGPARAYRSMPLHTRYRVRFASAVAVSLIVHALILSLRLGAPGVGLPGLDFPWAERRVQAPGLTVRLGLPRAPAAPAEAPPGPPLHLKLSTELSNLPKPTASARTEHAFEAALVASRSSATGDATDAGEAPASLPQRATRVRVPAVSARAREPKIQPKPEPPIVAQREPRQETSEVPPPQLAQAEPQRAPEVLTRKEPDDAPPVMRPTDDTAFRQAEEEARFRAEEAVRRQIEEEARQRALALEKELEAKRQAEARQLEDARREEEARRAALELEARRLADETARLEARRRAEETARLEATRRAEEKARQEAEELARQRALALQKEQEAQKLEEARRIEEARRQEEARRVALEREAGKRAEELARQQAIARQKELETKRLAEEAAARQRLEAEAAAPRPREPLAAAPPAAPAPRALSGTELAAKALEQLRTPGALRADPSHQSSPPSSPPRRRSIFGVERDVSLRMYVDTWRWKIEREGPLNYPASATGKAHGSPIVTVSIRSDGSLEDVLIHRSSGLREVDEAVLRIAQLNAPYSKFPPHLARLYDVIEIRRVWFFNSTLKLMDER